MPTAPPQSRAPPASQDRATECGPVQCSAGTAMQRSPGPSTVGIAADRQAASSIASPASPAEQCPAGNGMAPQGSPAQSLARQRRQFRAWHGQAPLGTAGHGTAWQCSPQPASHGAAVHCSAEHCNAGIARQPSLRPRQVSHRSAGIAWQSSAEQCSAGAALQWNELLYTAAPAAPCRAQHRTAWHRRHRIATQRRTPQGRA